MSCRRQNPAAISPAVRIDPRLRRGEGPAHAVRSRLGRHASASGVASRGLPAEHGVPVLVMRNLPAHGATRKAETLHPLHCGAARRRKSAPREGRSTRSSPIRSGCDASRCAAVAAGASPDISHPDRTGHCSDWATTSAFQGAILCSRRHPRGRSTCTKRADGVRHGPHPTSAAHWRITKARSWLVGSDADESSPARPDPRPGPTACPARASSKTTR